jgi:hypothetical protein
MSNALVNMAKAFGQLLDAHFGSFDRETSDLLNALAAWVEKHQAKRP